MERIQVFISADHSRAKLRLQGVELEIPLSNWNVNGGLGLTLPWDVVDVSYNHNFTAPEVYPAKDTEGNKRYAAGQAKLVTDGDADDETN